MVISAVLGTGFIRFLAALAILHQDDYEEYDALILLLNHPGAIHSILQIVLVQNS